MSKPLEPSAGHRKPDRYSLAWERLNFAQITADPKRLPVQSPDMVGRTQRPGPRKPFCDWNEDSGRFPWAGGLPRGTTPSRLLWGGQQALAGLRDESVAGWAWARRRQPGRGASRSPSRATRRGLREKSSSRQPDGGDFWAVVLTFAGDICGSRYNSGPEAESFSLSPEHLDFQGWVAFLGRGPASLREKDRDTSTNLARRRKGN